MAKKADANTRSSNRTKIFVAVLGFIGILITTLGILYSKGVFDDDKQTEQPNDPRENHATSR